MRRGVLLFVICLGLISIGAANGRTIRLSLKGSLTTSTRFIYNVDRPTIESQEQIITSNLGYGLDVWWNVMWDRFYLGLSIETISGMDEQYAIFRSAPDLLIPTKEGFDLKLIELSGYYIVPISSDNVEFYMGGGFGLYDGQRNSSVAGVHPSTIESTNNIGIHVLTGVIYSLNPSIGIKGEIKFRDPHFEVTEKFEIPYVDYQGKRFLFNDDPSVTRVNLYGINYMIGIVYQF